MTPYLRTPVAQPVERWICDWKVAGSNPGLEDPSDETLNRGPLALLLRRQYEFPFGINKVQFSFSFSLSFNQNNGF